MRKPKPDKPRCGRCKTKGNFKMQYCDCPVCAPRNKPVFTCQSCGHYWTYGDGGKYKDYVESLKK